jgi:hypothetical protein
MQRAKQAVAGGAHATTASRSAAAIEALVAPLVQLLHAADDARLRLRLPRALELYERALVLAETTMPESTLLAATLMQKINTMRMALAAGGNAVVTTDGASLAALYAAAWRDDEQLLRLSRRCLGFLRSLAAGTLLTLTPEESCFVEEAGLTECTPELRGVELFAAWAVDALSYWSVVSPALAAGAECLYGINDALHATLALQNMRQTRSVTLPTSTLHMLCGLLEVLGDTSPWLRRLRSTCGLSQADERELRKLHHELLQGHAARQELYENDLGALGARAAADVARHGLRSCALPACGATEAYPKTYKLCGRCRGAAYCCAAHSNEGRLEAPQARGRLRGAARLTPRHAHECECNARYAHMRRVRAQPCSAHTVTRCDALQPRMPYVLRGQREVCFATQRNARVLPGGRGTGLASPQA